MKTTEERPMMRVVEVNGVQVDVSGDVTDEEVKAWLDRIVAEDKGGQPVN